VEPSSGDLFSASPFANEQNRAVYRRYATELRLKIEKHLAFAKGLLGISFLNRHDHIPLV
jgi:hypothetical protein